MKKKGLLILGLIVTILSTSVFSQKLGATSIEEEKKKQQEMESQLADSKVILEELNKLKSDTDTYIAALDEKLNAIVKNVEELKTKMSDKQEEIDETNKEIKKQEKDIKEQYESMKKRIQFLFENGETYYFDMLLGSESVSDFLNKAEYLSDITTYDRNMLDKMKESKKKVVETRNRLKEEKAELSSLKKDAEKKQKTMEALIEDKQAELAKTESEIQLKQTEILNREEEIQAQKSLVEEMEAIEARRRAEEARRKAEEARRKAEEERRRQEEESRRAEEESRRLAEKENDGSDSDDEDRDDTDEEETEESTEQYDDSDWDDDYYSGEYGEFTWPLPGNYSITSEYGTRVDPIDGSVAYHNGLDIGASTGTPIHAIASGQVAWAYYSTTAGNWIGIDHGDGLYSIYMHSSQLLVSEGDMVSAGDVIALVGSTGRSTGPHLHLSVRLNGEYVNPWNYIQ